jgi:hypothetical protein
MLQQEVMIEKVRVLCERDERVVAVHQYGYHALGQGDRFSDIEFYLFFEDEALGSLDEEAWVSQIALPELYYVNEFGNGTAIFENLIRGEFHFEPYSQVELVDAWETAWFPSLESAVLVDKSDEPRCSHAVRYCWPSLCALRHKPRDTGVPRAWQTSPRGRCGLGSVSAKQGCVNRGRWQQGS